MKRRFSKILGVGLTLALLFSLILTAAPVSAVTTPVVTLTAVDADDAYVISKGNVYTVLFTTGAKVDNTADDEIVVVFDAGIDISAITAVSHVEIAYTQGIGGALQSNPVPVEAVAVTGDYPAAQTLTIRPSSDIGSGAIVQLTIGVGDLVMNPNTTGTYKLTVGTQTSADPPVVIEVAKPSADFTIKVPTIAGLPGVASVYNPTGVLMAQQNELYLAVAAAGPDYTIYVGPGTYDLETAILTIAHEGLTFVSTDGAATTIIDGSGVTGGPAISIHANDVTFDGFTVAMDDNPKDGIWVWYGTTGVTVQNNTITEAGWSGIALTYAGSTEFVAEATITGNLIQDCVTGIDVGGALKDSTISNNTITGCASGGRGINFTGGLSSAVPTEGNTITGNTIIDNLSMGIYIKENSTHSAQTKFFVDNVIEGNTISANTVGGIVIGNTVELDITNLQILDNEITDNEGVGILIEDKVITTAPTAIAIKFNTITGNDADGDGYGIQNDDDDATVDATLNWWGTAVADDVAAMVNDSGTGTTTYEPFLADTAEALFSASDVKVGAASIAKDTADVAVSVTLGTDDAVNVISVAKYNDNPEEALADAIAFFDVYVAGTLVHADTEATIKFYAGNDQTEVYIWSADTLTWGAVTPVSYSAYGGYVYVTIEDPAMLAGTPFALVAGEAAALDTPALLAPEAGERDVPLTPAFSWGAVTDADSYDFELADNALFEAPLVTLFEYSGLYYVYMKDLDYSAIYHWRVRARSGTLASEWAGGAFFTMAEPVEPVEPVEPADVILEPADIILEQPDIIVTLPAVTPITPNWIYVIIAVGAVLVIALLVLIIRTRRVA